MVTDSLFNYKYGNTFLHRCPAWCKLIFIPVISIIVFCFPPYVCAGLIFVQLLLALFLGFSFSEILKDLMPVFYYALILLFVKILSVGSQLIMLLFNSESFSIKSFLLSNFSWETEKATIFLLMKIFCLMQITSIMFKTTTALQIRECFKGLDALSMFISFIPITSRLWTQTKKAWFARGGKKSIKMYLVLLPVLFSTGMKKAWNLSRAVQVRTQSV
ncbi:MAG: hypothetical protein J5527_10060 [Treponema sp.]|nr:hypothetical protein [Treponema sp.]